jgi:hypothetical protein
MVRFVSSGTEAAMSAIRLARGSTGRDVIVKFAGCYHGHVDSLLVSAGSSALTLGVPSSPGVPAGCTNDTVVLPFNDKQALEELFAKRGDQIAGIIGQDTTTLLMGNMQETEGEPSIGILLENGVLFDAWAEPDVEKKPNAKGLTTKKRRVDYVMPGQLWFPTAGAVKAYVLPSNGLSSHRAVVVLFNRDPSEAGGEYEGGEGGYGEGGYYEGEGGYYEGAGGSAASGGGGEENVCETACSSDADCGGNECDFFKCVDGYCTECATNADCKDPEYPVCDEWKTCGTPSTAFGRSVPCRRMRRRPGRSVMSASPPGRNAIDHGWIRFSATVTTR